MEQFDLPLNKKEGAAIGSQRRDGNDLKNIVSYRSHLMLEMFVSMSVSTNVQSVVILLNQAWNGNC